MLDLEAKDCESIYQRRRRQAGEIPASVLAEYGGNGFGPTGGMSGGISAWPFSVAVADGLRWGDLLNTDPNTLVLIKDGLIGFAAKTETRGVSEGRAWGAINFAFPNEKWLGDGYMLYKQHSGNLDREFWIGNIFSRKHITVSSTKPHRFGVMQTKR